MDLNHYIGVFVGSSTIIAIIVFAIKKFIENTIKYRFEKMAGELDKQNELYIHVNRLIIKTHINLYDSLSEFSYKARNNARDFIESEYNNEQKLIDHNTVCHDFENLLYTAKIYLEKELFDIVHSYKILNKEINLFFHNDPASKDTEIREKYEEIEKLYNELYPLLKEKIDLLIEKAEIPIRKEKGK